MAQLTITLPDELEEEVRKNVRKDGYGSVSDFVRDAIKGQLSYRPSYWERFIASHVLENNKILKKLSDDSNWGGEELLSALQDGYSSRYSDAEYLVRYDELSPEDAHFVEDVLEMYGQLQHSYNLHGKGNKKLEHKVLFEGFDGNAGDGYLGYTNFLVDNGRFAYVKPLDKTPHLNSHSSVNAMYRRMLDEYKTIKNSRPSYEALVLSLDELKRVLDARIHPENR